MPLLLRKRFGTRSGGVTLGGTSYFPHGPPTKGRPVFSKQFGKGPLFIEHGRPGPSPPSAPYHVRVPGSPKYSAFQKPVSPQAAEIMKEVREVTKNQPFVNSVFQQLEAASARFGGISASKVVPGERFTAGGTIEVCFRSGKKMIINPLSQKVYVE